jgi:hypothetical protein
MKMWLLVVLALLAGKDAVAQQARRTAVQVLSERVPASSSIPATERKVKVGGNEFSVLFVTIDPDANRLQIALPRNPVGGGSSLWDFYRDEEAAAVLTGGYLDSFVPATPTGLVISNGTIVNDAKAVDDANKEPLLTGVLCFGQLGKGSSVAIKNYKAGDSLNEWRDCIQSGPLIVSQGEDRDDLETLDASLAGRITDASKERQSGFVSGLYERAFALKNHSGQLVLGVTSPASLFSLRYLLKEPADHGGFAAVDAILLTGWRTAGLIVSAPDPVVFGHPSTLLPNAIVVNSRRSR